MKEIRQLEGIKKRIGDGLEGTCREKIDRRVMSVAMKQPILKWRIKKMMKIEDTERLEKGRKGRKREVEGGNSSQTVFIEANGKGNYVDRWT